MATVPLSIPDRFQPALAALLTSFDYAQDSGDDAWQFALELPELLSTGATIADLRWLIQRGYAEHSKETTIAGDPARSFRPLARTNFPDDACVALTTAGAAAIRSLLAESTTMADSISGAAATTDRITGKDADDNENRKAPNGQSPESMSGGRGSCLATRGVGFQPASIVENARGVGFQPAANTIPLIPHYDADLHELRLGKKVVKRYRCPAQAQELILSVFEEEGWPAKIDDPLPMTKNIDPKRRLHQTVRNLNRAQSPHRIHFTINGNGQSIRWKFKTQKAPKRPVSTKRATTGRQERGTRATRKRR